MNNVKVNKPVVNNATCHLYDKNFYGKAWVVVGWRISEQCMKREGCVVLIIEKSEPHL